MPFKYLFVYNFEIHCRKIFSKIVYDNDFKVIKILEEIKFFNKKKLIIDIGANDGMSYRIMRKFTKNAKIISFEPNEINFKILKNFQPLDKLFTCKKIALSNIRKNNHFLRHISKNMLLHRWQVLVKLELKKDCKKFLHIKNLFKK